MGGCRFSRGALRHLLANRVYLGEISHKGQRHVGRHAQIVDVAAFETAQALLTSNSRRRRTHVSQARRMALYGRLFDADGYAMEPVATRKRNKRYDYHASRPLPVVGLRGSSDDAIRRVPAHAIEGLVKRWTSKLLGLEDGEPTTEQVRTIA
jgi:site-specific DNA recombinase